MKTNLSKIVTIILALVSLLMLGAIFIWAPACDSLLELKNGNMTNMKCFYTGKAAAALSIVLLVTCISAFFSKGSQWTIIIIGILLIALTYTSFIGIGICKMDTMMCHTTALWIRVGGILTILGGTFMLFNKNTKKI